MAAIAHAADMIVLSDADGRIEYANHAFERITGYGADEVLGLPVASVLPGRDRLSEPSGGAPAAGVKAHWREGVVSGRRPDGTRFECRLTVSSIKSAGGKTLGAIDVGTDASRERTLEAQLNWAARLAVVGQLAEGVAHDFNNILTAIRGYTQLVRTTLGVDSEASTDLEQVVLAADRATELTRQLLAFARQTSPEVQILDPAAVVEGIAPMLRRLLGEHIELTVSTAAGVGCIRANPAQLEQVVLNLAVNARDAMPDGGQLRIQTAKAQLDPGQLRERPGSDAGSYVLLTVSDTGIGMNSETAALIFEPFYTTKPVGQGTGMGSRNGIGHCQDVGRLDRSRIGAIAWDHLQGVLPARLRRASDVDARCHRRCRACWFRDRSAR